ncbi:MAG: ABC transporter ATP-binding protein, partial [Chloroflexota bacterium]|nr:ABC transporter ATP-binding protein [Chloroflexota bacterium]
MVSVEPTIAERQGVEDGASGPAIVVRGLTRRYGARAVVDDLSFDVQSGEVFALLGPNGAGKTTTVEILEGYRAPTAGSVRVLGLDPIRDADRLKPRIGLMLQEGGVYPSIRPLEALRLFASFYPSPADPVALLRRVGLDDAIRTRYRQLSGGQKARLSVALALVGRPELVFLDEPTAAMDPEARRATWELVRGLKADGVTVLLTTHFMEEAEQLADRVAIVDRGRLVALDSPAVLGRQGSDQGELRFRATPGLALADLAGRLGARGVREERPGEYRVAVDVTPAAIAALAAWLAEREVLLADLRVGRQSLEDVFLRLTTREEGGGPGSQDADVMAPVARAGPGSARG